MSVDVRLRIKNWTARDKDTQICLEKVRDFFWFSAPTPININTPLAPPPGGRTGLNRPVYWVSCHIPDSLTPFQCLNSAMKTVLWVPEWQNSAMPVFFLTKQKKSLTPNSIIVSNGFGNAGRDDKKYNTANTYNKVKRLSHLIYVISYNVGTF